MAIQITHIQKDGGYHENPHAGITKFKWRNPDTGGEGVITRAEMVEWIEQNPTTHKAFVLSGDTKVYCYVPDNPVQSRKFVQTYADRTPTNNLLSLPDF